MTILRMLFKNAFVAIGIMSTAAVHAATVYGYDTEFSSESTHGADYLLGQVISIDQAVTLNAAGIIFKSSGVNANVGIYTSNSGSPDQLLATTGSFFVSAPGIVEKTFTSAVTVGPGDYWFMAVYDGTVHIGEDVGGLSATTKYKALSFTATLPTSAGSTAAYTDNVFNYYVTTTASEVPIPPALWLFATGLLGLAGVARRK
jgi:hypothetical protein